MLQPLFMAARLTMSNLRILYHDDDILALSKPPGMLSVPGLSQPQNLLDAARAQFPNIRTVHRLDMATSGVIVYALNHPAQRHLSRQFESRQVKKQYAAVVHGQVTAAHGEIALPLICDWPNRPRQKIDWHGGKHAHTRFEVQHADQHTTYLHLFPVTGRSHQLRVHCLGIGHPIIGDELYAPASNAKRLMLHAECIEFTHPVSERPLIIRCRAPFVCPWADQQHNG